MNRKGRALVGYMGRDQALQVLNGGLLPTPDTVSGLENKWLEFKARAQARQEYGSASPIIKTLPAAAERALSAISNRADLHLAFAPHDWELAVVDLTQPIVTFQQIVQIDDALERVAGTSSKNWERLRDIALPPPQEMQFEGGFDPAQNAFTVSSLNPNLRVMSFEIVDAQVAGPVPSQKKVFGFSIGLGSSYVQFVEYQDRWMVRDGHHRLYGLMKAGITSVPAVVIHAKAFEETGAGRPGFFGYEQLYSPRPPQLQDFVSDDFSAEVATRAIRKVVRLKAEEFAVLV
ncbi:MAG TPA: ParB/Srx family N-terminal domain-containing protein [Candidatus Udaeobacter sp.]|nr:ParB/Srx family N-terminal domain-containing protein [Candidatus Udaeobacter sp.]